MTIRRQKKCAQNKERTLRNKLLKSKAFSQHVINLQLAKKVAKLHSYADIDEKWDQYTPDEDIINILMKNTAIIMNLFIKFNVLDPSDPINLRLIPIFKNKDHSRVMVLNRKLTLMLRYWLPLMKVKYHNYVHRDLKLGGGTMQFKQMIDMFIKGPVLCPRCSVKLPYVWLKSCFIQAGLDKTDDNLPHCVSNTEICCNFCNVMSEPLKREDRVSTIMDKSCKNCPKIKGHMKNKSIKIMITC